MRAKTFYVVVRDLHLYFGLFISPFVLVFSVSVFVLVHSWLPAARQQPPARTVQNLSLPASLDLAALRTVLPQIGVTGEITSIRPIAKEHRVVLSVSVPGSEILADLNLNTASALITERTNSTSNALVDLHKMPGPHNANLRGNWLYMKLWKWLADATVYLVLFISISGIYLWAVLRAERRIGLILTAAGAFSFFGLAYVLIR